MDKEKGDRQKNISKKNKYTVQNTLTILSESVMNQT